MKKYVIALLLLQSVALFAPIANPHDAASLTAFHECARLERLYFAWNEENNPHRNDYTKELDYAKKHNPHYIARRIAEERWNIAFAQRAIFALENGLPEPLSERFEPGCVTQ